MDGCGEGLARLGCDLLRARDLSGFAHALLAGSARLVPCDKAWLTLTGSATPNARRLSFAEGLTDDEVEAYYRDFALDDYTAWYLRDPAVRAYRDSDAVPAAMLEHAPIFEGWVRPMGMYWLGGAVLRVGGERAGNLLLMRAREAGDLTDGELERLDLAADLEEAWLSSHRARLAAGSVAPSVLTEREAEVARLAGEGMVLRDIASELCLSYATVRTHLAHAYQKLGVHSRVELARRMEHVS